MSPTEAEIRSLLASSENLRRYEGRREISELETLLSQDEMPVEIIEGMLDGHAGLLFATSTRLLFVDKGLMSLTVRDFKYSSIVSAEHSTGMLLGSLRIETPGGGVDFEKAPKDEVARFAEAVRGLIVEQSSPSSEARNDTPGEASAAAARIAQLERLARLRVRGVLTGPEFESEKRKLLEG